MNILECRLKCTLHPRECTFETYPKILCRPRWRSLRIMELVTNGHDDVVIIWRSVTGLYVFGTQLPPPFPPDKLRRAFSFDYSAPCLARFFGCCSILLYSG